MFGKVYELFAISLGSAINYLLVESGFAYESSDNFVINFNDLFINVAR